MLTYRAIQKSKRPDLSRRPPQRIRNRLPAILVHVPWYSIEGPARLAADVGVSRSTITRLINGTSSPSYRLVAAITDALSRRIDARLDMREIFTTDGTYPAPSACDLCRCGGCMPEYAFKSNGERPPEFRDMMPGDWSRSASTVPA